MNKCWIQVNQFGKIISSMSLSPTIVLDSTEEFLFIETPNYVNPNEFAYFDGELFSLGTAPSPAYKFDYILRSWIDPRSIADFKALKWTEIKAKRTEIEFGTFEYNGMIFDGDLDAQRRLSSYVSVSKSAIAAEQPFSADFTLADNTVVTLTAEDFVGIELAKIQSVAAAFAQAAAYRLQIEAAITVEEVQGIVWA